MITKIFGLIFSPLFFGLGFLAPLTAQSLAALELMAPGTAPVITGLLIGGAFGLMAKYRGSWIWVK